MRIQIFVFFLVSSLAVSAQQFQWNTPTAQAKTPSAVDETQMDETGSALFYADYFEGNPTALGETYNPNLMTAAHKNLPLGTIVKVSRIDNGLTTTVRINDRGAYCDDCIIDLSLAAAKQIDLIRVGHTRVYLTVIGFSNTNPPTPTEFVRPQQNNANFTARGLQNGYSNSEISQVYNTPPQYNNTEVRSSPATAVDERYPTSERGASQTQGNTSSQQVKSPNEVAVLANPVHGYAIQLGSYGNLDNAERHVTSLQHKGFDHLFIVKETKADGTPINRVMVAPFSSTTEAQVYLKDLRDYYQMDGIVVKMQ